MIYGDEKSLSFSRSLRARSLRNRRIFFVAERRLEFSRGFQPTGRRDHSSPVASATIEPGWRIAHTLNLRRNQSLAGPGPGPGRFNRRYATWEIFDPQPWVETHG